jgi:hypothetical protein
MPVAIPRLPKSFKNYSAMAFGDGEWSIRVFRRRCAGMLNTNLRNSKGWIFSSKFINGIAMQDDSDEWFQRILCTGQTLNFTSLASSAACPRMVSSEGRIGVCKSRAPFPVQSVHSVRIFPSGRENLLRCRQ